MVGTYEKHTRNFRAGMAAFCPERIARDRTLRELAERIEAVERRDAVHAGPAVVTGLPAPLDSLPRGVLHEWLCSSDERGCAWTPPILLYAYLAHHAITSHDGLAIWIGKRLWPGAHALVTAGLAAGLAASAARHNHHTRILLEHSLLVDPASDEERLWAIDLCLRSAASAVVIADASAMQLAHSRRLQLAAEAGSAIALLARPDRERAILSASPMRWRIERVRSPTMQPRWRIELVRCKGMQQGKRRDAEASLVLEHCRATGSLHLPADLADRSAASPAASAPALEVRRTG